MRSRRRRFDAHSQDDPLAGLVNLFDLWMVFSIALLLALVGGNRLPDASQDSPPATAEPGEAPLEVPGRDARRLEHFRVSNEKLRGAGTRLGTAYRLKTGEVVYVPDSGAK